VRISEGRFEGAERLALRYVVWEASAPEAALIVVHGLSEHARRYAEFGARMALGGVSTFAFDMRGHGESHGQRGHASRFQLLVQDLELFRREVLGLVGPGAEPFLLGHSLGGLIALRYLQQGLGPFRGAIIVAPWLATVAPVPAWKRRLATVLNRVLPALPFPSGIDANVLSRDPAIVTAYREDRLVHGTITPRLFCEAEAAMVQARKDHVTPQTDSLLMLVAGDDRLVDSRVALEVGRSLAIPDITVMEWPNAFHEVLNAPDRSEVFAELLSWIQARASAAR
jgi:lysophospholipase